MPGKKPVPVMKMSEVEETVVQWLWYPFIPFGKVTLIQGNPGKGKTWLAMAIAAYCTNGKELPNALPIEPFNGISSRTGRDARKQLENRLSYDWCQGRKTVALITE